MEQPLNPSSPALATGDRRRFKVGLSFAGENRAYVEKVADRLRETYGSEGILYDRYHTAESARPRLDQVLPVQYRDHCELVVVFLCRDYSSKSWCQLEWAQIQALIVDLKRADRVMYLLCDDTDNFSGIDGFDPKVDGSLLIGEQEPDTIASKILHRLSKLVPVAGSIQQWLPLPSETVDLSWITSRLDELAAEFSGVDDASLSRSFRRSFRHTFPTKTLAETLPELVHDFSWDDFKSCFKLRGSLPFLSHEKLPTLFQHWRAELASGSVAQAHVVLSILLERPQGSQRPAPGSLLPFYEFKSVLLIEREDQAPCFLHLPYPGKAPSRPGVSFLADGETPPGNSISSSQMITEMMNIARRCLFERGYDPVFIIDLYLPPELLDYDWSCDVQVPDGLDGTHELRRLDFRLRSLNRWLSYEMLGNREKLAGKHARFREQQDCFAWLASDHSFAGEFFAGLENVPSLDDLTAVVSLDAVPEQAKTRLKWYTEAILSAAPLVAWPRRRADSPSAELNPDLLATLEQGPFPKLEQPKPGCRLRRHRCGDDPGRLAFSKCGRRDRLVVLFDAPLATRAGELQPRLFLEADGGNLLAASP